MSLTLTPSQTIGPFLAIGLPWPDGPFVVPEGTPGAISIGGLVLVEVLFHYQGIGSLIYNAANNKDFPMLEAGVLIIGIVYMVATLTADIIYSLLNPRIRYRGVE